MPTRKQHYVNRFYLEPWAKDGTLASMIRGKIVPNALVNIANERDFYEVAELSSEDVFFLRHVVIAPAPEAVKPIFEDWLNSYILVGEAHKRLIENPNLSENELKVLRDTKLEFDEKYHAAIEGDLHIPLRQMREGHTDFLKDAKLAGMFFRSLALQYLRTKRMRAAITARMGNPIPGASMDRIWRPMIHMQAINVGASFFRERSDLRLVLLDSPPDERFIAGDQPVVNLVDELDDKGIPLGFELYYPVLPTKAMILVNRASPRMSVNQVPDTEEMNGYNRRIVEAHYEQLYADSADRLARWQELALARTRVARGWLEVTPEEAACADSSGRGTDMKPDITHKIAMELEHAIVSERQVVYILVELRKLLELQGLDRDARYRALIFCCDWAVHPALNRESAKVITLLFDRYETSYRNEPVGVSQVGIPELVEFCDHSRFRQQFIEACEQNNISALAVRDDGWWRSFLAQFSEVVRDCPIEAKAETTTYVTRVTVSATDPKSIGIFNREFAISWMWECRDRQYPNTVSTLF